MDRLWFSRLNGGKKSLYSFYDKETIYNSFIIARQNNEKRYFFCLFPNIGDYYEFYNNIKDEFKTMFEIIHGNKKQKPKFDIDISLSELSNIDPNDYLKKGQDILNTLLLSLLSIMPYLDISKDIIICTSHDLNPGGKLSYHIILPFYYHMNNIQAKAFYDKVLLNVPYEYKKFIDHSVYKSIQQFRLLGNTKPNTNRIKIFNKNWTFNNYMVNYEYTEEYKNIINKSDEFFVQFLLSLVSFIPQNSKPMPEYEVKINNKTEIHFKGFVKVEKIYELLLNFSSQMNQRKLTINQLPFEIQENKDNMILLKRTRPSFCVLCNRVHEHQNPYLLVFGTNGAVYYNCRRNENNRSMFIGYLDPYNTSEIELEFQKDDEEKEQVISLKNLEIPKEEDIFDKLKNIKLVKKEIHDKVKILNDAIEEMQKKLN